MRIPTWYYAQFDADFHRQVPAEGYGGWRRAELEIAPEHTALVLMHAWDCGRRADYPGWHRAVEYIPRADAICRDVLPRVLAAVRASPLRLYHVVSPAPSGYYLGYPGYRRAVALAGPEPEPPEQISPDPVLEHLRRFRSERTFPGAQNLADVQRGFQRLDFAPNTAPHGDEGIAENGRQLYALCREDGINHLVYAGFAINWCLLLSPGGMAEMSQRGMLCSALRQAVTAVENKETARSERNKELALWRVALAYGFVYDVDDFVATLATRIESNQ